MGLWGVLQQVMIFPLRHQKGLQLIGGKALHHQGLLLAKLFGSFVAFGPEDVHTGDAGIPLEDAGKLQVPLVIQLLQAGDVPLIELDAAPPQLW